MNLFTAYGLENQGFAGSMKPYQLFWLGINGIKKHWRLQYSVSYAQIITEAAKSVSDLHFVVYDGLSLANADSDCILIGYNAQCCKI